MNLYHKNIHSEITKNSIHHNLSLKKINEEYEVAIQKTKKIYMIWYKELDLLKRKQYIGYPGLPETKEIRDYIYDHSQSFDSSKKGGIKNE